MAGASAAACGGTNGREDLPATPSPNAPDSAVIDATIASNGGDDAAIADEAIDTDAGIQFANPNRLPGSAQGAGSGEGGTALTGADGGAEAAAPSWASWPTCIPDSLLTHPTREVPDDSGTCPTFNWTPTFGADGGSDAGETCDQCLRKSVCGIGTPQGIFPPCSDLRTAGTAQQGAGMGEPLFDLCAALFTCVSQSSCTGTDPSGANADIHNCYCGTATGAACLVEGGANGVCKTQIEMADQLQPGQDITELLSAFTDLTNSVLPASRTGAEVLGLYNCARAARCAMCFGTPYTGQ
jgi:hypothetical protein